MLCDPVAQQNHINIMMKRLFLLKPAVLLSHQREIVLSGETTQRPNFSMFEMHRLCTWGMATRRRLELAE
jgi:hypothetical protein